jgi:hypothetical protein
MPLVTSRKMQWVPSDPLHRTLNIMVDLVSVTCPSCFQVFEVAAPGFGEVPCDVDYDCEVCCRPLRIFFEEDGGEVMATGYGLGD